MLMGEYDRAISDFDKTIEMNPNYAQAYLNRGITYMRKGMLENALAV